MAEKVTVRPIKFFRGSVEGKDFSPESKPFQVDRTRAAELRANGLVEIMGERQQGQAERTVPRTGHVLQYTDGRPNDEPVPGSDSPAPGTGVPPRVESPPPVEDGQTNPEPKPGSAAPAPGTAPAAAAGPAMVVDNEHSLIPETPGLVERQTSAAAAPAAPKAEASAAAVSTPEPARSRPAAATPVREGTRATPEAPAPRGTAKRRDR